MSGLYLTSVDDTSDRIPRIVDDRPIDKPAEQTVKQLRFGWLTLTTGICALLTTAGYMSVELFGALASHHDDASRFTAVLTTLAWNGVFLSLHRDSAIRRLNRVQRRVDLALTNQAEIEARMKTALTNQETTERALNAVCKQLLEVNAGINEVNERIHRVLQVVEDVHEAEEEIDRAREALDALPRFNKHNGAEPHLRAVRHHN